MEIKDALEIYNEQAKLGKMINSNEECLVAMAKASEKQVAVKPIPAYDDQEHEKENNHPKHATVLFLLQGSIQIINEF